MIQIEVRQGIVVVTSRAKGCAFRRHNAKVRSYQEAKEAATYGR
jgi:hypothetical protein